MSAYRGWERCYELTTDSLRLVVTGDIGPRIIHFGFAGEENVFWVDEDTAGQTGGSEWQPYGGHRLWHAPEAMPRTYAPDNDPVQVDPIRDDMLEITAPTEASTGIQKYLTIKLSGERVHITHYLTNRGMWPVTLAPWALTMMAPGGMGIAPLPPRGTHPEDLNPNTSLTLWPYTDMSDPRWGWGRQLILLRQDVDAEHPQKIGLNTFDGWLAYANAGALFVKLFPIQLGAPYPDFGSPAEMFTNRDLLELESLGPLVTLEPGATVEHQEMWALRRIDAPIATEDDAIHTVLPLVASI